MAANDHLALLALELDAFGACLAGDLATPVAHCGDWTLHDLVDHVGRGNLWAAAAVTERRGDHRSAPAPRDRTELAHWYADTAATLLAVLRAAPETPAWTFAPPHTVGFWRRRRCLETLIHRWDAEHALGRRPRLDPALAADGVAEVLDTMLPRQVARGRTEPPRHAVRLVATDTGGSWLLGPGEPVATVDAAAADLLLLLWGRLPADDPAIAWSGDPAAGRAVLARPLVP